MIVFGQTPSLLERRSHNAVMVAPEDALVVKGIQETITPADPRHPQHAQWLAAQARSVKQGRLKSVVKYAAFGGGGLLVLLLTLSLLKKRRVKVMTE